MTENKLRYPAVPLVTIDPYISIWSASDMLYSEATCHWTGRRNTMSGFVSADGKWYRFMGSLKTDTWSCIKDLTIIPQKNCEVFATKSVYEFENDIFTLEVTFRTPFLPDELDVLSRPASYISYRLGYKDNKEHDTKVYFEISPECCVNNVGEDVEFGSTEISVFCGKGNKNILEKAGDEMHIDWGYLHLAAPGAKSGAYSNFDRVEMFHWKKDREGCSGNWQGTEGYPVLGATKEFNGSSLAEGFLCVAYDDIYSIEYFGEKLKGYWTRNGDDFDCMLKKAIEEYDEINEKCDAVDKMIMADGEKISKKYAELISLSYRQVIAAHKLVHKDGDLLFFSKECGSNGCIGTVDITYPSIPMFLKYCPRLIEGMVNPIFDFAENHDWEFEFAPHDVGLYPKANGQVYGYEQDDPEYIRNRQMPVEESGNMIICMAALCKMDNNIAYAKNHYYMLKKWADYLVNAGWDPDNQLCTDDFAGHLAHNCNLSLKGIIAIAAFGYIEDMLGIGGSEYLAKAKELAKIWEKEAFNGKNYKLAFDCEDSWSLKYNLIWDRFFGFGLFSEAVAKTEVEFYKTKFNEYGVPLDSRRGYTKSDWQMWTACMSDDKEYLDMVMDIMWKFANETTDRVPFTDWYETDVPEVAGWFRNRTVQGGIYAPLLFI